MPVVSPAADAVARVGAGSCAATGLGSRLGGIPATRLANDSPIELSVPVPDAATVYVEVRERGVDALVEAGEGEAAARADNPIERAGTRRLALGPVRGGALRVRVTTADRPAAPGRVELEVLAIDAGAADG
ncbi:MAG: hypothetical protein JSR54_13340, partial [Proteobacteria bacterium]|nr:hypothetical protein [Pseudomonadota bacterium]